MQNFQYVISSATDFTQVIIFSSFTLRTDSHRGVRARSILLAALIIYILVLCLLICWICSITYSLKNRGEQTAASCNRLDEHRCKSVHPASPSHTSTHSLSPLMPKEEWLTSKYRGCQTSESLVGKNVQECLGEENLIKCFFGVGCIKSTKVHCKISSQLNKRSVNICIFFHHCWQSYKKTRIKDTAHCSKNRSSKNPNNPKPTGLWGLKT